jgi:hypothetical protein
MAQKIALMSATCHENDTVGCNKHPCDLAIVSRHPVEEVVVSVFLMLFRAAFARYHTWS